MTVINTNISALTAQNAQRSANNMMGLAMQRLSTGQRINSAKDDAAGLAISQMTCTPDWYRLEVESFALMADG